jgi:hypothetical protein
VAETPPYPWEPKTAKPRTVVVGVFDDLQDAEDRCAELNEGNDPTIEAVPADMKHFLDLLS